MDEIDRVCNKNYIPTDEDLLLVRYRTLGMTEKLFRMGPKPDIFKFVDVGGQRNGKKNVFGETTPNFVFFLLFHHFVVYVHLFCFFVFRETKMDAFF